MSPFSPRPSAALIKIELDPVPQEQNRIVDEFRTRFYDTQKFFDPYAGGKFAQYLFSAHLRANGHYSNEEAHHLIEEAQLFVEAAHNCYGRITVTD